jgi:glycerol-3-phosphate dehydrogenase
LRRAAADLHSGVLLDTRNLGGPADTDRLDDRAPQPRRGSGEDGLRLYDFFGARNRVMPNHRFLFRKRALREMPHVTPDIVAGGIYYDAKISRPERLVYELVTDGLQANQNALATNFTRLLSSTDGILTFQRPDGSSFAVRPKLVINAAGPWIDTPMLRSARPRK